MELPSAYMMREYSRVARRWLEAHWRITALGALALIVGIVWIKVFLRPFDSREMVILYRPSPDGTAVVFNLDDEYNLRSLRLSALDESGNETETLWSFRVPGDAPRLSTFSIPPRGRAAADNPPPPIEPGRAYRLRVSASGATGTTDFTIKPGGRRNAG